MSNKTLTPHIVFMGSPEFALPTLQALADKYSIAGVVTQPDRSSGRGKQLTPSPVKKVAMELGLPVIQPEKLSDPETMRQLFIWNPNLIIVAAFGQILKSEVLELPKYGCLNVHASILPRWRGAAPIPAAILSGDKQTGITIMLMNKGLDSGPIISQKAIAIAPDDTSQSLGKRLAKLGVELLLETLPAYLHGEITPIFQDEREATYARMLKKEDGLLDFCQIALELERKIRAFTPWPGTYTFWNNQRLNIKRVKAIHQPSTLNKPPGYALIFNGYPAVITQDGLLIIKELQPAGKKIISGQDFIRGARNWEGILLG